MPHTPFSHFVQHSDFDERYPFPLARSVPGSAFLHHSDDHPHRLLVLLGCLGDLAVLIAVRILAQVIVQLRLSLEQVLDRVLQPRYFFSLSAKDDCERCKKRTGYQHVYFQLHGLFECEWLRPTGHEGDRCHRGGETVMRKRF